MLRAAFDIGYGDRAMYVCVCNGFTDRQVRDLGGAGGRSTAGVYRSLGVRPQCGKCVPMVREILRETAADPGRGGTASTASGA